MSISLNGLPMGTEQIKALASTDSWMTPSEYVDPQSGKTYRADTLQDLLDLLQQEGVPLFDHDEIRRQGKTTAPKGGRGGSSPSGDDAAQWDRLLINLQHYPDPERAREIIVEALANPDVSLTRVVTGDRTATKTMKGRRAVLTHEVHHNDERGPHFMAQVHTVALGPDGYISPKWSFRRGEDAKAMVEQVNQALAKHGLAPMVFRLRDETGASVAARKAQLDAEASEEYRQAAEKGELPQIMDDTEADQAAEALPVSARKEALRQAAQQAGAQAASLYAQAQALQKQNAMYRQALRALEAEEQHLARIAALNERVEQAAANAAEAEAQHAAQVAELTKGLEVSTAELTQVNEALEATQQHAAQLSEKLEGVEAELAEARDAVAGLEEQVQELQGNLATEQQTHQEELTEIRGELDNERKARKKVEESLEKVRADLGDERTAHGATQASLDVETKRADAEAQRADHAEATATEAVADMSAMREQLAVLQAQVKAQEADLARERKAREDAEREARQAASKQAKAEAERDARPTQRELQQALADQAKLESQRDALRERLEAVLAEQKPAPGNDNDNAPKV